MKIKIVMKSVLDCHLKPDLTLLNQAKEEIIEQGKVQNNIKFELFQEATRNADFYINKERELTQKIKNETNEAQKNLLKEEKKNYSKLADESLEYALKNLCEAGGFDAYHYNYDSHFNKIVAGLMGSTCYMKEDFQQLKDKSIRNIMAIASAVEANGHHSTFGHSHITLEITGIPKALAMVLNNEKEYCTSEKSARYTTMDNVEQSQLELYNKWKDIFIKEINDKYGKCQPFFDEKGVKTIKLAQENARYMLSVFTASNMVYTTSFRQLNYLAHWFEREISNTNSNSFYNGIKDEMKEFVQFVKDEGLYSSKLEDHKDRSLSLFGKGILKNIITSEVYSINYNASLACLAQEHRHRTLNYHINEFLFDNGEQNFFVPPILKNNTGLVAQWLEDIQKVKEFIPQGRLVQIVENGQTDDFLLKAMERECSMAQWEIMDITKQQSKMFSQALQNEIIGGKENLKNIQSATEKENIEEILKKTEQKKIKFDKLSKGARCTAGYECASKCGFGEGITMNRLV